MARSSETDSVRRATTRGTVLEEHEDTVDEEEVFLRDSIPEVVEESICGDSLIDSFGIGIFWLGRSSGLLVDRVLVICFWEVLLAAE